jgi:hypothetical protein
MLSVIICQNVCQTYIYECNDGLTNAIFLSRENKAETFFKPVWDMKCIKLSHQEYVENKMLSFTN